MTITIRCSSEGEISFLLKGKELPLSAIYFELFRVKKNKQIHKLDCIIRDAVANTITKDSSMTLNL